MDRLKLIASLESSLFTLLPHRVTPQTQQPHSPRLHLDALQTQTTNGVYFVRQRRDREVLGVFKPLEEEAKASRAGMKDGFSALKETAAFLLDTGGFARVPKTQLRLVKDHRSCLTMFGSFQMYVKHMGTAEDYSSSLYSVQDVHSIGLLDLRLFNTDRHMGNMVVTGSIGGFSLIPIDHGFCLPDFRCLSDAWFEWWSWEQTKQPFDENTIDYINQIDIQHDCCVLQTLGLRDESIMTYVLSTSLVKIAINSGMTLYDMATLFQRDVMAFDEPSTLETYVTEAMDAARSSLSQILDLTDIMSNALVISFNEVISRRITREI